MSRATVYQGTLISYSSVSELQRYSMNALEFNLNCEIIDCGGNPVIVWLL